MMRRFPFLITLAAILQGAVVYDRMAVVVGKHTIKSSDIYKDLRVAAFLNREPLRYSADMRRKAAERLIDQTILRDEIATGGYKGATEQEAQAMLDNIRKDRFAGSEPRLQAALASYALTEDELRAHLLWQLTVLRFIDQRFRNGVIVTDEDVRSYYDRHLADLKNEYRQNSSFEALQPKIRASIEGERINQNFAQSMEQARKNVQIRYLQGAFE